MLFLYLFFLEIFILLYLEKKIWGTFFTPLFFLSFPYTFATIIAIFYSYISPGIPDFYMPSLMVWMIGLFFFFLPSLLFSKSNKNKEKVLRIKVGRKDDYYNIMMGIAVICIAISLIRIRLTFSNVESSFGSDEFSEEYEVKGILSHISVLMSAIFSYMIYKADLRHKFSYVVILLSLIGMYAIGVKSWIIAPFLIGYSARIISGKTHCTFKTIILPVLICVFVFILSYYIVMIVSGKIELGTVWILFVINHFVDYLSGASLALSLDIKAGIQEPMMIEALFAPIINLGNFLLGGEYISSLNPIFLSIGDLGETNVRTFMGTIWVYSQNVFAFILIVTIFSFLLYAWFYYSRQSTNVFVMLANCSNLTFLALGFFDFYWLTLGAYEITCIFMIMSVILRFRIKKYA